MLSGFFELAAPPLLPGFFLTEFVVVADVEPETAAAVLYVFEDFFFYILNPLLLTSNSDSCVALYRMILLIASDLAVRSPSISPYLLAVSSLSVCCSSSSSIIKSSPSPSPANAD